jgi:hypothetical protein
MYKVKPIRNLVNRIKGGIDDIRLGKYTSWTLRGHLISEIDRTIMMFISDYLDKQQCWSNAHRCMVSLDFIIDIIEAVRDIIEYDRLSLKTIIIENISEIRNTEVLRILISSMRRDLLCILTIGVGYYGSTDLNIGERVGETFVIMAVNRTNRIEYANWQQGNIMSLEFIIKILIAIMEVAKYDELSLCRKERE